MLWFRGLEFRRMEQCGFLCVCAEGAMRTWQRGRVASLRGTKQQCVVFQGCVAQSRRWGRGATDVCVCKGLCGERSGDEGFWGWDTNGECGKQCLPTLGRPCDSLAEGERVCSGQEPEESHRGRLAIPAGEQRRIWWITSF